MNDHALKRVFPTLDFTQLPRKGTRHFEGLLRRAHEARDYRHLASLPDRLLEDIGVTRDQADALAASGIWKRLPRTGQER
jgi:uncharacterized protein YjiS (DUF1127 family)